MALAIASSPDAFRRARWRLALRFTLLVVLLLASGGAGVYVYVKQALLGAFDTGHDLAVLSLRETIAERTGGLAVDEPAFRQEFEELNVTLGVVFAAAWGEGGRQLAEVSMHAAPIARQGPTRQLVGSGDHLVVVRRESLGDPSRGAVLVVGRRAGDLLRDLDSLVHALAIVLPLTLVFAAVTGWVLAGHALRPVALLLEQQRAFMADASHELRTPLAVLRAQAEVGLESGEDTRMRAALEVVARTSAQLGELVDGLLHLARADAAAFAPATLVFAFDELVRDTTESFEPLARNRGSELCVSTPRDDVLVEGDPVQLQRLVGALVDNAVRHADPGPIEVTVTRVGSQAELIVEDSGPGIPPDLAPRVFERFVRGKTDVPGGYGLGLAIARSIVHAHCGVLTLERGARGGTLARVRIPASAGERRAAVS